MQRRIALASGAAWNAREEPFDLSGRSPRYSSAPSPELFDGLQQNNTSASASQFPTHPQTQSSPLNVVEKTWRKTLYERQPFEDNYVDPVQFLQEMRKNSNVSAFQYSEIVKETFAVIQHLSIVVIFVFMFSEIVRQRIHLWSVIGIDVSCLLVYAIASLSLLESSTQDSAEAVVDFFRQAAVIVCVLMLLSPILQTLTVDYTDDTIWALSITSMFVHILFADYSYLNCHTDRQQHRLSVNAAIFSSVLLASRIPSPLYASALISFGTICFTLSPSARYSLKKFSIIGHVAFTFTLCGIAIGCLLHVPLLMILFSSMIVLLCFAIPLCFVKMQNVLKTQINGPWDEARPKNSAAAAEWANAGLLS